MGSTPTVRIIRTIRISTSEKPSRATFAAGIRLNCQSLRNMVQFTSTRPVGSTEICLVPAWLVSVKTTGSAIPQGKKSAVCAVARPSPSQKGQEVELLQDELQNLIHRRVNLKIEEVSRPEIQAQLVAEEIAMQLAKRASFRRTMKKAMELTMDAGAKGIKVQLAGRLGGAEMARREKAILGSIPLSTLLAKSRGMGGLVAE